MLCGCLALVQLCSATLRKPFGLRNWKRLEYIDINVDVLAFGFDGDRGKVIGGAGLGGRN